MSDPRFYGLSEAPRAAPVEEETSVFSMATSRQGAAAITFAAVCLLVLWIRPPMVLQDISTNEYRREYTVRWWVMLLWAAVAAALVFFAGPAVAAFAKTQTPTM